MIKLVEAKQAKRALRIFNEGRKYATLDAHAYEYARPHACAAP